jgi:RNA polymerase sigma-70 factor, ECF subfamily
VTAADEPGRLLGAAASALGGAPAEACEAMNEAAFERLYAATAGPILGYLAAVTGRREVADDLVQETYCRFLAQGAATANLEAEGARRYLFRIATNLMRDRWRSGEARTFEEPEETGATQDLAATIDMRAMLEHLKPKERTLLWLAYVEGMDHAEIAAATGVGRLSVRTLLLRARRKAQRYLRPEGDER